MGHELDQGHALIAREHVKACDEVLIRQSVRGGEDIRLHEPSCITAFFVLPAKPCEAAGAPPAGPFSAPQGPHLRWGVESRGEVQTAVVERASCTNPARTSETRVRNYSHLEKD